MVTDLRNDGNSRCNLDCVCNMPCEQLIKQLSTNYLDHIFEMAYITPKFRMSVGTIQYRVKLSPPSTSRPSMTKVFSLWKPREMKSNCDVTFTRL